MAYMNETFFDHDSHPESQKYNILPQENLLEYSMLESTKKPIPVAKHLKMGIPGSREPFRPADLWGSQGVPGGHH